MEQFNLVNIAVVIACIACILWVAYQFLSQRPRGPYELIIGNMKVSLKETRRSKVSSLWKVELFRKSLAQEKEIGYFHIRIGDQRVNFADLKEQVSLCLDRHDPKREIEASEPLLVAAIIGHLRVKHVVAIQH